MGIIGVAAAAASFLAVGPIVLIPGAVAVYLSATGMADIEEACSDLEKVEKYDLSPSYNAIRDGFLGGSLVLYELSKIAASLFTGNVIGGAARIGLKSLSAADDVTKMVQKGAQLLQNPKTKAVLGTAFDVGSNAGVEYYATGQVNMGNLAWNTLGSGMKDWGMSRQGIGEYFTDNKTWQKTLDYTVPYLGANTVDFLGAGISGREYDPTQSFINNAIYTGISRSYGDPIDSVSGTYLHEERELFFPGIGEPICLKRSYQSTRKTVGWCGKGWQFSYESRLYQAGEVVHVVLPCDLVAAFIRQEEGEDTHYRDTLGNGRFTLVYQEMEKGWQILDSHVHSTYFYDEEGKLIAIQDKNKQRTVFIYEKGQLKEIVTPLGCSICFTFKQGRLVELKDQMGRKVTYTYQGEWLTHVTHVDGGITTYQYDESGYLIGLQQGGGKSALTNTYDEAGRVLCQTTAAKDTYEATYQEGKRRVLVKSSKYSGIREYHYDEHKAITKVCYPDGSTEEYEYDAHHNQTLIQNRRGGKLYRKYDEQGRLVREETPEGLVTSYSYDKRGDRVLFRDNAGRRKAYGYDAHHNLIQVTESIGEGEEATCYYTYDEKGRLLSETDGEGNQTTYTYEEKGAYPITTTYADGSRLTCEYDALGRKLSEQDGAAAFFYGYNQGGHKTVVRDAEGKGHHYFYDSLGRLISHYSPRQWEEKKPPVSYRYDVGNRLTQVVYSDGSCEKLFRDSEGNVVKKIHPVSYEPKTGDGEGTRYVYDEDNRLIRIHYPDGGIARYMYDPCGNRIKHILPAQYNPPEDDGPGWCYRYDAGDRLTSITGPGGEPLSAYTYDLMGNCIQRTDERGNTSYATYDLRGRCLSRLLPVGEGEKGGEKEGQYQRIDYVYDKNDNRVKEIRYGGIYNQQGQCIAAGEDLTLTFAYDARNRLIRAEDGKGGRVSYTYDARGNRLSKEQVIQAEESSLESLPQEGEKAQPSPLLMRKVYYRYNKAGRLIQKRERLDSGLLGEKKEWAKTTYGYDANGNLIHIVTPEGYAIRRHFDDRDRLRTEVLEDRENGLCLSTTLTYDRAGRVVQVIQQGREGKRELTYDYDVKDRLTHIHQLDGPMFTYGYDGNNQLISQKQLLPKKEGGWLWDSFSYDHRGRLLSHQVNGQQKEAYTYDQAGQGIQTKDADGVGVSLSYGLRGEVREAATTKAREAGKVSQRFTYDGAGRITGIEEGEGERTHFLPDGWGRIRQVITPEKGRETYTYDGAGNIRTSRDALGRTLTYTYNSRSQLAAITDPWGRSEYFVYDKEGRLIRHTDRKGTLTETRYNVYGKPVYQACTDKNGNRQVMGTWVYDDFGHLKEARAGGFHYTYEYRPDGKLLTKKSKGKPLLTCTYYPEGSLKSLRDARGRTCFYTYDEEGRLETVEKEGGEILVRYGYTKAGRMATIESHNGLLTRYTYDKEGKIASLQLQAGRDHLLYDAAFHYDLRGNRIGRKGYRMGREGTRESITTTYSYDKMNRLVKEERPEGGERYTYDQAGNRLTKISYHYALKGQTRLVEPVIDFTESYCYNEGNQLTERRRGEERTTYTYDENGSLLKKETTRGTAKGRQKGGKKEKTKAVTRYHYDFLNRQIRADLPEGSRQEAVYDGEGLRAEVVTAEGTAEERYTFFYHQGELLGEEKAEGFFKSYVRGHGLVGIETEANQYYSCHLDEQGSTIYLTEGKGEEKNRYQYDAFGNLMEQEEGIQNRILYTGQQYDQETDQYYLRARYYHPNLGRFMQEDSYRGDGLNLYAYCANNPVLYYDPSGHDAQLNTNRQPESTPVNRVNTSLHQDPYIQLNTSRQMAATPSSPLNSSLHKDPYALLRDRGVSLTLTEEEINAANLINLQGMYGGDRLPEVDPLGGSGGGKSGIPSGNSNKDMLLNALKDAPVEYRKNPNTGIMEPYMKQAQITDYYKVILRRDVGDFNHGDLDHWNLEVQTVQGGNLKYDLHLYLGDDGNLLPFTENEIYIPKKSPFH